MAPALDFDALVLAPCMDAFAEPVTYVPGAGPEVALTGVFDRAFRDISGVDDGAAAVVYRPALGCRAAAFPAKPAENEQFVIRGQFWVVAKVQDDGLGHYHIFLHGPA